MIAPTGPILLTAVAAATFILSTGVEVTKPHLSKAGEELCAKTSCSVLTDDQVAEIYRAGVKEGEEKTLSRIQTSCLKDEV